MSLMPVTTMSQDIQENTKWLSNSCPLTNEDEVENDLSKLMVLDMFLE